MPVHTSDIRLCQVAFLTDLDARRTYMTPILRHRPRDAYVPRRGLRMLLKASRSKSPFISLARVEHLEEPPQRVARGLLKRNRVADDTSEEEAENLPRKKRRLRLDLITSKLSEPYALPTTNIARRTVRKGIWARQRLPGRNLLRKAAILNSIVRRKKCTKEKAEQKHLASANCRRSQSFIRVPADSTDSNSPRAMASPTASMNTKHPPPAPSEYDIFDHEDDDPMEEEDDDECQDETSGPVYSNFNVIGSEDCDDTYDQDYSFGSFDTGAGLTGDAGEKAIDLVMEIERQDEVSRAPGSL